MPGLKSVDHIRTPSMTLKVFFSPALFPEETAPATRKSILSVSKFAREIGFETQIMSRTRLNGGLFQYYSRLSTSFRQADVFLAVYPVVCNPTRLNFLRTPERYLLRLSRRLRSRPGTILYIVDLPIEQALASGTKLGIDKEAYNVEKDVFESFDVLCVFNESMGQSVSRRYGVPADKFVEYEIQDHATNFVPPRDGKKRFDKWTIAYAGNYSEGYVGRWVRELPQTQAIRYVFRGRNWNWVSELGRSDIFAQGFLTDAPLLEDLSRNAHFGIINAPSEEWVRYYNYTSTSKFGTYSAAGLPILVSSKCRYIASLVSKYGVGLTFNGLDDIPSLVTQISQSNYEEMKIRSLDLGEKVRTGYFFKRAMRSAMDKLGFN